MQEALTNTPINLKSYKDFLRIKEDQMISKKKDKRRFRLLKARNKDSIPVFYDRNLVAQTPDPSLKREKNYYEFFQKSKSALKVEKDERLKNMKKRKYDADTALFKSLGHRIERYGRKILVSSKGAMR